MLLLLLGLVLWVAAHWFKRLAPDARARLGAPGKGIVAVVILLGLAAIIFGYRAAPYIHIWSPPLFLTHLNNLMMLLAFYIYMSTGARPGSVWIASKIKHPQLTAVKVWATAHLLVNGDLASILLFGSMLGWAVGSVILINRSGDTSDRSAAPIKNEIVFALVALVAFGLVGMLHTWVGVRPFPG